MSEMPDISTQDDLAALLEGQSDEDITTTIEAMGTEDVIAKIADAIVERFQPERAAGQSAVIQWQVTAPSGTTTFRVDVTDGKCTAALGSADAPRVTLAFALPDFLRFVSGQLDGMQAFMGGKLKLTGDVMFAQSMQAWFNA